MTLFSRCVIPWATLCTLRDPFRLASAFIPQPHLSFERTAFIIPALAPTRPQTPPERVALLVRQLQGCQHRPGAEGPLQQLVAHVRPAGGLQRATAVEAAARKGEVCGDVA